MLLPSLFNFKKLLKKLLGILFPTSLFFIMKFIEYIQPFNAFFSPNNHPLMLQIVNAASVAFVTFPLLGFTSFVYNLIKNLYGDTKNIRTIFYLLFTFLSYPFEYTFLRILFSFREATNVPPILKTEGYFLFIAIGGLVLDQLFNKGLSNKNLWNKVLGEQLSRLGGYFIIFLTSFMAIMILDSLI